MAFLGRTQSTDPLQVDDVVDVADEGEDVATVNASIRRDRGDDAAATDPVDLYEEHTAQITQASFGDRPAVEGPTLDHVHGDRELADLEFGGLGR